MSQVHYVENIEDATRAYDTKTKQYVTLEEPLNDNFYIAEAYGNESDEYIIVKISDLTELHYCRIGGN